METFTPHTALLAGATGLVGSHLLSLLLHSPQYTSVKAVTRHPLSISHSKLENIVVPDFTKLDDYASQMECDIVFCCLGTTIKKAGTKDKFFEVDYTYPHKLAQIALKQGAKAYFLVSALGADKGSLFYYNRVKGEIETAIRGMGYWSVHIFRPSLLLGKRQEKRLGEDTAQLLHRLIWWLIPLKYRGIKAEAVAKAMLHYAQSLMKGNYVHSSGDMQRFS